MLKSKSSFVPVLTSPGGSCLTSDNWTEVGITSASYYLDALLIKPGIEFLKEIPHLGNYLNWPTDIIINASMLLANKEGIFTLISPYDGRKITLSYEDLLSLLRHLAPSRVILPPKILTDFADFWASWDLKITPYFAVEDPISPDDHHTFGVYTTLSSDNPKQTLDQLSQWNQHSCYVQGPINKTLMHSLRESGVEFIETDEPAQLGMNGVVYHADATLDLSDTIYALQMTTVDPLCLCPTCVLPLTRAYLHHLYLHTPLLCQRFLIQHNIHRMNTNGVDSN